MRRSFAGLFFGLAFTCACLAISGFLLQRTAFSPDNTADSASVILGDSAVKQELVTVIVDAAAPTLEAQGVPREQIRATVTQVAETNEGAALLADILRDAHAHLIGDSDEPVQITPEQLVQVIRDERAAVLPAVTLPVPRVGILDTAKDIVGWLVPITGIGALVFLVLCFLAHPERTALVRTLGLGLIVLAALIVVFGYVLPKLVPPLLTDSVWANIPPRLADDSLPLIVGAALVLVGAGLALFIGSARMGRSRRWSTPVSTYRYREERSWS